MMPNGNIGKNSAPINKLAVVEGGICTAGYLPPVT